MSATLAPGQHDAVSEQALVLAEVLAAERLRIVASLIRTTGDLDTAEDAVADATERAVRRWPLDGIPTNPGAWLTTVARRRAVDLARRRSTERRVLVTATCDRAEGTPTNTDDDRLRLMFTCCHPALTLEARVALTLKVVAALPTEAVARVFLVSEATMSQRLLRAKQKIANAAIPYRVPEPELLDGRLDGVLSVVYLIFTEGYASQMTVLAEEAVRLGRLLTELVPAAGEPRALLALMLLQHSRRFARVVDDELVRLEDQDRRRWDYPMIAEAQRLLRRPVSPARRSSTSERGPYRLQAELAAIHAEAQSVDSTDWVGLVALYDELVELTPGPIVALNRAIALGVRDGPETGLRALETVADHPQLANHPLLCAARGDLLARAGRLGEAREALSEAADLSATDRERRALLRRATELSGGTRRCPTSTPV